MHKITAGKLLELNAHFYLEIAEKFSATRNNSQPGWKKLWQYIKPQPETILDVGCGNGRFVGFLQAAYAKFPDKTFNYQGIDWNQKLLEIAGKKYKSDNISFTQQKILFEPQSRNYFSLSTHFDFISCFAVLHHIPGFENRLDLLKNLAEYLNPHGYFALSLWRFMQDEKLAAKVIPWEQAGLSKGEVEKNDYLFSWGLQKTALTSNGKNTLRYCHYFDDEEIVQIYRSLPLKLSKKFASDGKSHALNYYLLFRKD